ncbi:MAG: VIT domain-containing protein [Bryobacteraceae bacterium]
MYRESSEYAVVDSPPRPKPGYPQPALPPPPAPRGPEEARSAFDLIFGVLLPFTAIVVELSTRLCASVFFNPLPTPVHIVLALLVPSSGLALWTRFPLPPRVLAWMNSFALVVAALYAVPFLPLIPLGLLTAVMLIGLLPLSPYLSLWAAIRQRRRLSRNHPAIPSLWRTIPAAVALLVVASMPHLVSRAAMHWTIDHPDDRPLAVWLVRHLGSESALLEAMQARGRTALELLSRPVPETHARDIFYLVTGRDPAREPQLVQAWSRRFFDAHQGSATVGSILPNLSMASSQIDGSVDPTAAVGYFEWTMLFRNAEAAQREARATVQLPHGAVVSRVTLWIDGEPREAAFGGRATTASAYRSVVAARRDPLLVTTAGPDRVLLQCFPVPPNGEMKIRIGITTPIDGSGAFTLPYFQEHNFTPVRTHQVWIEAGKQNIRRGVPHADLHKPVRDWLPVKAAGLAWTPDPQSRGFLIRQRIVEQPGRRYAKLVYVVDGSAPMGRYADVLSREIDGEVILAADEVRSVARVSRGDFAGGADNVPALLLAQERASLETAGADAAIVWIHGPQPVALTAPDALRQFWARRPGQAPLISVQLEPGPNRILEALDGVAEVRTMTAGVDRILAPLLEPKPELVAVRERVAGFSARGHRTSAHLARLWALEESARTGDAALAAKYQLVTPLTGAVVLESRQQYEAAGLSPAAPGTVPTAPEPETWALMAIGLAAVAYQVRTRRNGVAA